jgi:uncharacterized protein with FMN-binding domain
LLEVAQSGSNKKIANSLVALSSAAVLAVYAAGYSRTRSAASRLEAQAVERRPAPAIPPRAVSGEPPAFAAGPVAPVLPAEPARPIAPVAASSTPALPAKATISAATPAEQAAVPAQNLPESKVEPAAEPAAPVVQPQPATLAIAAPAAPAPVAPIWKDGTYLGWGSSRHGDIQASVVIEGGRIVSATIAQCLTRYSCSVIDKLPPEVAQRQSPEVDYVSGATQSANAFYYAVVDALGKAK